MRFFIRNTLRFSLNDLFLSSYLTHEQVFQVWASRVFLYSLKWKSENPVNFPLCGLREVFRGRPHSTPLGIRTGNSTREALLLVFPAGQLCRQSAVCCLHGRRHRSQEVTALTFSHLPPLKTKRHLCELFPIFITLFDYQIWHWTSVWAQLS